LSSLFSCIERDRVHISSSNRMITTVTAYMSRLSTSRKSKKTYSPPKLNSRSLSKHVKIWRIFI